MTKKTQSRRDRDAARQARDRVVQERINTTRSSVPYAALVEPQPAPQFSSAVLQARELFLSEERKKNTIVWPGVAKYHYSDAELAEYGHFLQNPPRELTIAERSWLLQDQGHYMVASVNLRHSGQRGDLIAACDNARIPWLREQLTEREQHSLAAMNPAHRWARYEDMDEPDPSARINAMMDANLKKAHDQEIPSTPGA